MFVDRCAASASGPDSRGYVSVSVLALYVMAGRIGRYADDACSCQSDSNSVVS